MTRALPLLACLALSSALAINGSVPAVARLYAQPSASSKVLATLTRGTKIDIRRCTGGSKGWCQVTAAGRTGFIPRPQVKAGQYNCASLIAVGLGDLLPTEASYNRTRDRDRDGLGCDILP